MNTLTQDTTLKPAGILQLCRMSVPAIFSHVELLARNAGEIPVKHSSFLYVPGNSALPLLVAHADTVHASEPEIITYDKKRNSLHSPTGIGADDRAGVYATLQLWTSLTPKPGILITDGEEWGGIGAQAASEMLDGNAESLGTLSLSAYPFFLEIDRKGKGEMVFYNDEPKGFREYIGGFGFKQEHGLFSDISVLGESFRKCSVNLSAGYYDCHTTRETLILHHLEYTIKRAHRLLADCLQNPRSWTLPEPRKWEWDYFTPQGKRKGKRGKKKDPIGWDWMDGGMSDRELCELFAQREKAPVDAQRFEYGICDYCGVHDEVYPDLGYGDICATCFSTVEL